MSLQKAMADTFMNRKFIIGLVSFIFITLSLGGVFSYQASNIEAEDYDTIMKQIETMEKLETVFLPENLRNAEPLTISDTVNENSDVTLSATLEYPNMINITFTLTWKDESNIDFHENQPDTLGIKVIPPEGEAQAKEGGPQSNPPGGEGKIEIKFSRSFDEERQWNGEWTIVVYAEDCGDQEPRFIPGPLGFRTISDDSNAFTLTINIEYYEEE